jgi:hypothetical protein
MKKISYAGYRFPPEIIHQAIWLYLRFTLSFRDVEDLLAERGIAVSYETVRRWVNHFGPMIAADLRKRRPKPHTIWPSPRVTHNVRLPRRRSPASYCAQFLTLNFIFGMWCRRSALCLFGMARIGEAFDNPRQPTRPRRYPCNNAEWRCVLASKAGSRDCQSQISARLDIGEVAGLKKS